jgi:hypothetical protein
MVTLGLGQGVIKVVYEGLGTPILRLIGFRHVSLG